MPPVPWRLASTTLAAISGLLWLLRWRKKFQALRRSTNETRAKDSTFVEPRRKAEPGTSAASALRDVPGEGSSRSGTGPVLASLVSGSPVKQPLGTPTLRPHLSVFSTSPGVVKQTLGENKSGRVRRSLSQGPSEEVQHRLHETMKRLPGPAEVGRRRIELLVHNLSHKDMILSLAGEKQRRMQAHPPSDDMVLCRPRFTVYQQVSEKILDSTQGLQKLPTASFPVYKRERAAVSPKAARERTYKLRQNDGQPLPVGFDVRACNIPAGPLRDFRVRRDDAKKLEQQNEDSGAVDSPITISGVYFPLLSTVIPKWRRMLGDRWSPEVAGGPEGGYLKDDSVCRIVFLVSGIGIPRDQTSSSTGNSTEKTAVLIEQFLAQHHPEVHVVRVHSTTNIFRYDENIAFVKSELLPLIEYYRDMCAELWGVDWRAKYRITISFANGSPARVAAINAALRPYRPFVLHMWELKTFWHAGLLCLDDVEAHSFEDIDTTPPVPVAEADADAQMVAQEMIRYKQEVLAAYGDGLCSDLDTFWLRKTKKPVLAVLLVRKEGSGEPRLYRGCNMEVSMPTGSLCAERNAIGTALAADVGLSRRDLKLIAVLSLSFRSIIKYAEGTGSALKSSRSATTLMRECTDAHKEAIRARGLDEEHADDLSAVLARRQTVMRSYSVDANTGLDTRVISVDADDLNPLRCCGVCTEWLKKIAEMNPEFRMMMFTDEGCHGLYIESIMY